MATCLFIVLDLVISIVIGVVISQECRGRCLSIVRAPTTNYVQWTCITCRVVPFGGVDKTLGFRINDTEMNNGRKNS